MPPQIRDLNQLIQQQQQALAPQKQFLQQQMQDNATAGEAQRAGLQAQQRNAFEGITQEAQNMGMLFGGFKPNEQAKYTASTYLPEVAKLEQQIAANRGNLYKEQLGLDQTAFDKANAMVESDRSVLNDWNQMTAQQQFQASEAEKARVFEAQQNEAQRQQAERLAAQDRAAANYRAQLDREAKASEEQLMDLPSLSNEFSTLEEKARIYRDMINSGVYQTEELRNEARKALELPFLGDAINQLAGSAKGVASRAAVEDGVKRAYQKYGINY